MKDDFLSPRESADGFGRSSLVSLGFVLCLLQLADGFLTGVGVLHYGPHAEANLFLKQLMISMGPVEALVTVKSMSMAGVLMLCRIGRDVVWIREAMMGLIAVYLYCAIIPWTIFIASRIA